MSKESTKQTATTSYSAQYKDPRWQKKRLEILERDGFACRKCGDTKSTLHVHHSHYEKGHKVWEYPNQDLATLCESCHKTTHKSLDYIRFCIKELQHHTNYETDLLGIVSQIMLVYFESAGESGTAKAITSVMEMHKKFGREVEMARDEV